uniref:Uncharacterized protein n=1 Tax=Arundo donax TaxID=35708 RepID=A0A0A9BVB4_ARUDO
MLQVSIRLAELKPSNSAGSEHCR